MVLFRIAQNPLISNTSNDTDSSTYNYRKKKTDILMFFSSKNKYIMELDFLFIGWVFYFETD